MKNFLIIIVFLWQLAHVYGQPNSAHFFSLQDGLSNQQVLDIVHDDEGFMWVATELGLNRYAGKSFKSYYAPISRTVNRSIAMKLIRYCMQAGKCISEQDPMG